MTEEDTHATNHSLSVVHSWDEEDRRGHAEASGAMRAARPPAFAHVDPEDGTRAPETSNLDECADKADRRTDGLLGHRLASVVNAATVRLRKGHVLITDGPFIETKE